MHRTIFGETHKKTRLFKRKAIEAFLEKNELDFNKVNDSKVFLYQKDLNIISDNFLNFLNIVSEKNIDEQLKSLMINEFDKLEKIYPYAGNAFLDLFFNDVDLENLKTFKFHEDDKENFIETLEYQETKDIANVIFDHCSLEHDVSVESHPGQSIVIKKIKDYHFLLPYDFDFLGSKNSHTMKNYKFIIIDGIIESVGEIHHLLFEASQNKLPYVIFCFGMSPEVKHVIIENNKKGITEVFPVCIDFNEDTVNILNDIALVHKSDVISSQKGQTISAEVRKKLNHGNTIKLTKNGFELKPVVDDRTILMHKKYLEKRLQDADNDNNRDAILKRIKRLSGKSIKIFLPEQMRKNRRKIKELDYFLRFLKFSDYKMIKYKQNNQENVYFMPHACVELVLNTSKSLKSTYDSIHGIIVQTGE